MVPVALDAGVGPGADPSLLWAASAGPAALRFVVSFMMLILFCFNFRSNAGRLTFHRRSGHVTTYTVAVIRSVRLLGAKKGGRTITIRSVGEIRPICPLFVP